MIRYASSILYSPALPQISALSRRRTEHMQGFTSPPRENPLIAAIPLELIDFPSNFHRFKRSFDKARLLWQGLFLFLIIRIMSRKTQVLTTFRSGSRLRAAIACCISVSREVKPDMWPFELLTFPNHGLYRPLSVVKSMETKWFKDLFFSPGSPRGETQETAKTVGK